MKMKICFVILLLFAGLSESRGQEIGVQREPVTIEASNNEYVMKLDGKVVLENIDSIGLLKNNDDFYIVKKDNKYGMYSRYGAEIIPTAFEKIDRVFNQYWIVSSNQKFGIFNIYTTESLPAIYDEIKFSTKFGAEFIVKKDNKYGILDDRWAIVVPIEYDFIKPLGGLIELVSQNGKSYLLNKRIFNYNIILNKTFITYGRYPSDNKTYYVFEKQQQYGIVNSSGDIVWQPKYDDIIPKRTIGKNINPQNIFFVKRNNKWGVMDLKDSVIVPIEYQSVDFTNDSHLSLETNNLKQFYDLKNRKAIDGITFEKYVYLDKYSRIEKNGLQTLIDNETMKLLFPFKYAFVIYEDDARLFSVGANGKYGIVDFNDKQVIPMIYNEPLFISCGNKIVVRKGSEYGVVNTKHEVLIPFSDRAIIAYSDRFERLKENRVEYEKLDCDLKLNGK
jgi:hypothetical protein